MHELFLMLSSVMPEEMILDELQSSITEYKLNPSEDNKRKISMFCMMFSSKECAERTEGGVIEMIKHAEIAKQGYDLLNPKKQ